MYKKFNISHLDFCPYWCRETCPDILAEHETGWKSIPSHAYHWFCVIFFINMKRLKQGSQVWLTRHLFSRFQKYLNRALLEKKMKFQYLIFLVFTVFSQMHTHHGAARLIKKLLVTNKYNNNIRPVYNVSFGSKIKLELKYGVSRIKIMIFRAVIKQSCSC